MSRNRFELLLSHIHFQNNDVANQNNKLYKIQNILDLLNQKCKQWVIPSHDMCIDESMIAFQGRLVFKQYMVLQFLNCVLIHATHSSSNKAFLSLSEYNCRLIHNIKDWPNGLKCVQSFKMILKIKLTIHILICIIIKFSLYFSLIFFIYYYCIVIGRLPHESMFEYHARVRLASINVILVI